MKFLMKVILPFFAVMLMFTACDRDNEDLGPQVDPTPIEETVTINPIVSRSQSISDEGWDFECFVIDYSFSVVDDSQNVIEISSDDDLEQLFENEDLVILDFVYPLGVTTDNGAQTVNNGDELGELFAECIPSGGWEDGAFPAFSINHETSCYELVYPVSLEDLEGDIIAVNDYDELEAAVTQELYFFVFPMTLIDEAGDTFVVTDIDGIFEALIGCNGFGETDSTDFVDWDWDWETGFEYIGCYELQFPFTVNVADGTQVTVNNHMEYCDLMLTGEISDYAFPLTLIGEDDAEFVVNSETELETLLLECDDVFFGGDIELGADLFLLYLGANGIFDDPCYAISFPINVLINDDTQATAIGDFQALEETIFQIEHFALVYPVNIVLSSDGSTVELTSIEDIFQALEACE